VNTNAGRARRKVAPPIPGARVLVLALLGLLSPLISAAQPATVPIEAATLAAAEKLPTFYPGRWDYYSSVVLFDLAGRPAAYAIIFSSDKQTPPALAKLEALTEARSKDIAELFSSIRGLSARGEPENRTALAELGALDTRLRKATVARSESEMFATVVTGAQDSSPIVLKVHRGLPTSFSRKYDAEDLCRRARPNQTWRVVRPLYLGTFDDAFEVAPAGSDPANIDRTADPLLRAVVDLRTDSFNTVGELATKRAAGAQAPSPETTAEQAARQEENARRWAVYKSRANALKRGTEAPPAAAAAVRAEQTPKTGFARPGEDKGQLVATYKVHVDLRTGQTSITPDKGTEPPSQPKPGVPGGKGLPPVSKAEQAQAPRTDGVKFGTAKAGEGAADAPKPKANSDATKGDTYAVYGVISGWAPGTDVDGDGYYETYAFNIGIDADASPGPATIYGKMICTTTSQAWWSGAAWTVQGTPTDYVYFGFDQTDFAGSVTGNTTLDFTVEMWNQAKSSVLATDTTVTGESSLRADVTTTYGVYAVISDWVPGADADADGFYETYAFNIGIDADASPGPATVNGKMTCTTTGQTWWSASSWAVQGTAVDYHYFGFDQTSFAGVVTGNTSLDFTVEIWNQAKTSLLASDTTVSGEPVKADYVSPSGYYVFGIISGWVPGADLDGDGYFETYAFNIGIDADALPGPATIYGRMICTTTGQAWWSATPWTVQGGAVDYVYFSFDQTDFASLVTAPTNLDFTVEIWDQAKTSLLASDTSVTGEPVSAEGVIVVNEIPGASSVPSSVPTYLNNPTMYPPASGGGGGICWATAIADIFGYWDRNPYASVIYWNLVDHGVAPLLQNSLPTAPGHNQADVRELVIDLGTRYYGPSPAAEDVIIEAVANGERGLNFDATYLNPVTSVSAKEGYFATVALEIDAGRPIAVGSWGTYFGGAHQIPVIGYMDAADGDKFYIHRNTGGTETEYVNLYDAAWGAMDADIIVPGGTPTDQYENLGSVDDDQLSHAKTISPEHIYEFRQTHNFVPGTPNDTDDWVKFSAVAGRRYTIQTEHLGARCDTTLLLDDGVVNVSDDDSGPELRASKIVYDAAANRTVYIRIREYQSRVGSDTNYDISVTSVAVAGPTVTTGAASGITPTGATLNGAVNPNGSATSAYFEWGLTTSYGNSTSPQSMGSGTSPVAATAAIGPLAPNTTYHFRLVGTGVGTVNGSDVPFATSANPPSTVTTGAASGITPTAATLNGTVNPNGSATSAYFEWGLTTSYGNTTSPQGMGSGTSPVAATAAIGPLAPNTTYHFRLVGTGVSTVYGSDVPLTTSANPAPTVTTGTASGIMPTGATLNGTVNPNGSATSAYFEWGLTTSYGNTTSPQSMGSGTSPVAAAAAIGPLTPNATYHFRLVGTGVSTVYGSDVPFTTSACGSVVTDFTGDGKSDILWRHGTQGDVWLWPMNDAARTAEAYVRTVADTNWEIRGEGDFDGDGHADILWRHKTNGTIYLWPMNDSTPLAETFVGTVDPAYDIVGVGDFNADGNADILWRHLTNGEVWIWLMDGPAPLSQVYVGTVDPAYVIKGARDFDGDGKADIVWHHATAGEVWVWLMNGTTRLSATWIGTVADVGYQIAGVADFTGDAKADVLWRHATSGEVWLWRMSGATRLAETWVGTVPDTGYRIVGSGDYNGDGKAHVLWHHATTGEVWVWLMDGATRLSETWVGTVSDVGYQIVRVK
jgi:hypothetical protein